MDTHSKTVRRRFGTAIAAMAATFRQEATRALVKGYELGLEDLPIASIEQAVARALRQCKFMPSAAELRELAGEMLPAHRAVLAWGVVVKTLAKYDHWDSVDFDDPVINATIRNLGGERGWEDLPAKLEDEGTKWVRKDFERVYIALAQSGISLEATRPLIGFHDRDNAFNGYHKAVKKAVVIACGLPAHRLGVAEPLAIGAPMELLESVGRLTEVKPEGTNP